MAVLRTLPLVLLLVATPAAATGLTPVQKVVTLLQDLSAKVTKEGEAELKAFKEYTKWCDDTTQELGFEIKTATSQKNKAAAALEKCTSDEDVAETKIGELAGDISTAEKDLVNATSMRTDEHTTFTASEAELMDAIDTLSRAVSILSKEMSKNPAFLQKKIGSNMEGLVETLSAVIDVASFTGTDRTKLMALVQSKENADEDDEELGAPAAAVYKTHSSSILDILADMKDKAEEELASLRKSEMEAAHKYALVKQSLSDQSAALTKELGETKSDKAEASECMAQQKSDLAVSTDDLKKSEENKAGVEEDCATTAADHKESMENRAVELAAIAKAIEIIGNTTGGAEDRVYSFVQVKTRASLSHRQMSHSAAEGQEIVDMVSKLAQRQHSSALTQLASRIGSIMKYAATIGEDPFAKVKGLIEEMIERLQKEASAEAEHKAYCDEETAKTKAKKEELTSDIDSLTAKIDKATATSTKLKEEGAELQKELAALTKLQAEMDKARADEKAAYAEYKADLEQGITGVSEATRVLREYYGKGEEEPALVQQPEMPEFFKPAAGAGGSIIEILEVIASDFTKSLAQATLAEESAETEYDKTTQENKITKATKDQDVKYKTQEAAGLDKAVAEHSTDREGLQTELSAVLEYSEKLVDECVAKPETYEERKARRAAEINGLKEALTYLEAPAALIEQGSRTASGARRFRRA
mmetsp:Transcript_29933/g.69032  ORF Transcript_29933/g.69032 Transcript_29933/m.69032 type:complete len:704 (+) Transcript_29933:89-2200(+)